MSTCAAWSGDELPPVDREMDYPKMLNGVLPPAIRILGWAPAPTPDFSARFACGTRTYHYYFTHAGMYKTARTSPYPAVLTLEHPWRCSVC